MNDILFSVIQILIIAVITAVARYLIPFLTTKLRESKWAFAADIVENAVLAAEQMISGSGMGSRKFEQAMNVASELCKKYKINLTDEQILTLIEAAVGAMNAENSAVVSTPQTVAIGFESNSEE